MAKFPRKGSLNSFQFLLFSSVFIFSAIFVDGQTRDSRFSRDVSPTGLRLHREKLTHLRFYFHNVVTGQSPTVVTVAQANTTNASSTLFGSVKVFDDLLTEGPEQNSIAVGRAQGTFVFASQTETALLMTVNFVFTSGKYNGSSLTVLGRNLLHSEVRELPIVGGSGCFRFARGYALTTTHILEPTGDGVTEYDLYALHPSSRQFSQDFWI